MSEDDEQPDQIFSDNSYYNDDSKSPSDHQNLVLSQKDFVEDEGKEEKNGKMNRQPKHKTQSVASVAVPEQIVIFIDTSLDMAVGYTGTVSNKTTIEAPTIMKEALRVFLVNKLAIAKDTSFALISIQPGNVKVISDFTSDIKELIKSLSEMEFGTNEEGMTDYDITPMFLRLFTSIQLPEMQSNKIPPAYVVRVILIYNNSHYVPRLNEIDKSYEQFLNSPYFIFDVVHLHEPPSDFNSVMKIYEQFSKIISPRSSYLLECSRNVTLLFNTFAKLLAHPYQRVSLQGLWEF